MGVDGSEIGNELSKRGISKSKRGTECSPLSAFVQGLRGAQSLS